MFLYIIFVHYSMNNSALCLINCICFLITASIKIKTCYKKYCKSIQTHHYDL